MNNRPAAQVTMSRGDPPSGTSRARSLTLDDINTLSEDVSRRHFRRTVSPLGAHDLDIPRWPTPPPRPTDDVPPAIACTLVELVASGEQTIQSASSKNFCLMMTSPMYKSKPVLTC